MGRVFCSSEMEKAGEIFVRHTPRVVFVYLIAKHSLLPDIRVTPFKNLTKISSDGWVDIDFCDDHCHLNEKRITSCSSSNRKLSIRSCVIDTSDTSTYLQPAKLGQFFIAHSIRIGGFLGSLMYTLNITYCHRSRNTDRSCSLSKMNI